MNALTLFGLVAVSAMLVFYWQEDRSPACVLGFAVACAMGSVYGFLQGAWPFGLVESVWSVVALRRWWTRRKASRESAIDGGSRRGRRRGRRLSKRNRNMLDVIYILVTVIFFGMAVGYTYACGRL